MFEVTIATMKAPSPGNQALEVVERKGLWGIPTPSVMPWQKR